jgi:GTP pyrophosphokinase
LQVYDVCALRVVVRGNKDACYRAMRAAHGLWAALPGRDKDYIRNRKENGYQSLHNTFVGADGLPLELQIRTAKMHWIAEYGLRCVLHVICGEFQ